MTSLRFAPIAMRMPISRVRNVELLLDDTGQTVVFHVRDDSDDGDPGAARIRADFEAAANRIAPGPVNPRHLLVDERDHHRIARIRGGECTPSHDPLPDG